MPERKRGLPLMPWLSSEAINEVFMKRDDLEGKEGLKEILEEAEILAELKEEEKIRKKNAKIILLASIAVLVCGVVFYFGQSTPEKKEEMTVADAPPPQEEEMFPEAGKVKIPGEAAKEMAPLKEPLSSEEDARPTSAPVSPVPETSPPPSAPIKEQPAAKPVEAVKKVAPKSESKAYRIRVGAFVLSNELEQAVSEVKALGLVPTTKREKNEVPLHKVLAGPYSSKEKAADAAVKLKNKGIKGFITKAGSDYFVQVGNFYSKESAQRMKESVEKAGFSSRPSHEPSNISCDTLYAAFQGDHAEAEGKVAALRKKGFDSAKIVSK